MLCNPDREMMEGWRECMEIGSTIDRRGGAGEPLEHRRNWILDEARVEPIAMVMRRRRLEWFGRSWMKQGWNL